MHSAVFCIRWLGESDISKIHRLLRNHEYTSPKTLIFNSAPRDRIRPLSRVFSLRISPSLFRSHLNTCVLSFVSELYFRSNQLRCLPDDVGYANNHSLCTRSVVAENPYLYRTLSINMVTSKEEGCFGESGCNRNGEISRILSPWFIRVAECNTNHRMQFIALIRLLFPDAFCPYITAALRRLNFPPSIKLSVWFFYPHWPRDSKPALHEKIENWKHESRLTWQSSIYWDYSYTHTYMRNAENFPPITYNVVYIDPIRPIYTFILHKTIIKVK